MANFIRYNTSTEIYEISVDDGDNWDPIEVASHQFPATHSPSSDANALDDYEEGTWTPVIGGSGGESGQSYSNQEGTYIKIGQNVTVWFDVTLSAKGTITTTLQIKGLPFTSLNRVFSGVISFWSNLNTAVVTLNLVMAASSTAATPFGTVAAVTTAISFTTADVTDTTRLVGTISYRASA